jgi:hypothetical protein
MLSYLNLDWRMIERESCRRLAQQNRAANGANPKTKNCLTKSTMGTLKRHERVRWRDHKREKRLWNYHRCAIFRSEFPGQITLAIQLDFIGGAGSLL